MDAAQLAAITDPDVLRALVADKVAEIAVRDETIRQRDLRIEALTHEIARLRRVQFQARSERMDPDQRALFDEAMLADLAAAETELEALTRTPERDTTKPRTAPRRRPLPSELPRVESVHEPACAGCSACGGDLVRIGEHVRERLDCKPLEFFVRREVYPQYACRSCEQVVAQPVPAAILDRSQAAPGLLAQVATAKYLDHLPLYRQEAIYARSGVELSRSTLAEWIGAVGVALAPLVAAVRDELLTRPVLHADETPVAQLDPGAGRTKRAYIFAYRSADAAPLVVFDYCPSRSGRHAERFLDGWRGSLMVDDFAGYKGLFRQGVTELGCFAHARRKFVELEKSSGSEIAREALGRIAALYRIEQDAGHLDPAARHAYRQAHAAPRLIDMHAWLRDLRPKVLSGSATANAIDYSLKRWTALTRYLDDGRYPIDNNPVENAIRPIAIGRKNWLFAGSETAGRRACAIMSLLATAKANGHDPHAWLSDVLDRLPTTLDRDIGQLLPHSWDRAQSAQS
jgi:transposase